MNWLVLCFSFLFFCFCEYNFPSNSKRFFLLYYLLVVVVCVCIIYFSFFSLGLAWNWLKTFSPWSQVVVIVHRMIVCMNECATPIDKSTTVTYIYSCTSRIELSSQSIYFVYTVFKGRSEAENMRHINNKMVCLVIVYDIYYFLARTNHFGHCSNTPKEYYLLHE